MLLCLRSFTTSRLLHFLWLTDRKVTSVSVFPPEKGGVALQVLAPACMDQRNPPGFLRAAAACQGRREEAPHWLSVGQLSPRGREERSLLNQSRAKGSHPTAPTNIFKTTFSSVTHARTSFLSRILPYPQRSRACTAGRTELPKGREAAWHVHGQQVTTPSKCLHSQRQRDTS